MVKFFKVLELHNHKAKQQQASKIIIDHTIGIKILKRGINKCNYLTNEFNQTTKRIV